MTKTTTTCDTCHKEIEPEKGIPFFVLEGHLPHLGQVATLHFCSRSCLAEYLKPKTETTP